MAYYTYVYTPGGKETVRFGARACSGDRSFGVRR